ncbi:MAG: UDP-galactose-lipid carrier transferase [Leptospiraceae bacterium]|nr:UDP-galactose-lipid carrier transferase [Leptospiraceae bacterium]
MKTLFSLKEISYPPPMEKSEYKKKIDKLQDNARILAHLANYKKRAIVIIFEGWDAAGKGGAIRRLTSTVDPRLYKVVSIAAPNDVERKHNYLWRFWTRLPRAGYMAIFDRSWYGRVLVERVEGFAKEEEWKRAFNEIIFFEEDLKDAGIIVIKFWLQITPEEQLKRFKQREEDPMKRWKLTEEDWRNREKWNLYEAACEEMIQKTSKPKVPWIVVPANDKYTARTMIIEEFCKILERELK